MVSKTKTALRISRKFSTRYKEKCCPFFFFCVGCVASVCSSQKSVGRGNKDAVYKRGNSIEHNGHSVIKLHVVSRKKKCCKRNMEQDSNKGTLKGNATFHVTAFQQTDSKRNMTPIEDAEQERFS
jgi:hypothetical protein